MAKIKVNGSVAVVTSGVKFEDFETVSKYRPEALKVYADEEKTVLDFSVVAKKGSKGIMSVGGVIFGEKTRNEDGFACITIALPTTLEKVSEVSNYISDAYGAALVKLNKVEAGIPAALEDIAAEKATIAESIIVE